jgi:hypothetical protein
LIDCKNSAEQEQLFDKLTGMGLVCKILVN